MNWTDYAKRNEAADPLDFANAIREHGPAQDHLVRLVAELSHLRLEV